MGSNDFIKMMEYSIYKKSLLECVEYIYKMDKVHIISGNPEVLYTGLHNEKLFNNFISKESLIIPDGVGVQIAAKYLGTPVQEKIAGIELMKALLEKSEINGESVYLLGTSQENLVACIANLTLKYPNLKIAGYHNGFFDIDNPKEILEEIQEKKPAIVFVAMGCPRQETFITRYMDVLPARIFMGVGGSFDVIAEKVNRAPRWMIKLGLEWLYRVTKEPWRIKRLTTIPKFLILVFKNRKVK